MFKRQCVHKCSICMCHFPTLKELDDHLDWHYQQNRMRKERNKKPYSRQWYPTDDVWIYDDKDILTVDLTFKPKLKQPEKPKHQLVVNFEFLHCFACGELFEQVYDDKLETWLYDDVVYSCGYYYHPKCIE